MIRMFMFQRMTARIMANLIAATTAVVGLSCARNTLVVSNGMITK